MFHPTAEMAAVAWLKTVDGVPADQVATKLPADTSPWAASGFVQVSVTGGSPEIHSPMYRPVITVDCWACNPNSQKPPWGKAGSLAAAVQAHTYSRTVAALVMPSGFYPARLHSAFPLSEPRRVLSDEAGFARVQIDIEFVWSTSL